MAKSIIELNKDVECFVTQAINVGGEATFVHFADVHNVLPVWNRIVEYINYYSKHILFAIHTGDYCGGCQQLYTDMYKEGNKCFKNIYNVVGNHDCVFDESNWVLNDKKVAHSLLFNNAESWNVNFHNVEYSMSYYKDITYAKIRLIALDDYYDVEKTRIWLADLLTDALNKGYSVITCQHETTGYITNYVPLKYNPYNNYVAEWDAFEKARKEPVFDMHYRTLYEDVIVDFINKGGKFVCNFAGHDHIDGFGYTSAGVLNLVVGNATTWDKISDIKRVENTKSMDLFNVVTVDTDNGFIKVVRVGANQDVHSRTKKAFSYDYINKIVRYNY